MSELRYWKSAMKRAAYTNKSRSTSSSDDLSLFGQRKTIPFKEVEIKQTFYFGDPSRKFWKTSDKEAVYVLPSKEISFIKFSANKLVRTDHKPSTNAQPVYHQFEAALSEHDALDLELKKLMTELDEL